MTQVCSQRSCWHSSTSADKGTHGRHRKHQTLCNPLSPPRGSVDITVQPVVLEACLLGPCFLERSEELKLSEDCAQTDQPRRGGTKGVCVGCGAWYRARIPMSSWLCAPFLEGSAFLWGLPQGSSWSLLQLSDRSDYGGRVCPWDMVNIQRERRTQVPPNNPPSLSIHCRCTQVYQELRVSPSSTAG